MILLEAIEYCEDIARKCELGESPMVGSDEHWQITKWLKELKEYKEKDINVPLTWEELKQMQGKPVWVEVDGNWYGKFWAFVELGSDVYINFYQMGQDYPEDLLKRDIGKTWQAYRKERK